MQSLQTARIFLAKCDIPYHAKELTIISEVIHWIKLTFAGRRVSLNMLYQRGGETKL